MFKWRWLKKGKKTDNFYELLGKEEGLKQLVSNFYSTMETDSKAKNCLAIHDLTSESKVQELSKERLMLFLSGWLGGPNLFVENVGPPRMRMRHAHVKIGETERTEWLYCMNKAIKLHKFKLSSKQKKTFLNSVTALSLRIKNSA